MEQYVSLLFRFKTGCKLLVHNFHAMLLPIAVIVCFIPVKGTDPPLLVYPRVLEERSSDGRTLLHIHPGLTLNLRKASVVAPEFRVLAVEDGEHVTHTFKKEDLEEYLYEDEKQLATVQVVRKGSSHEVEGVLGPDRRIQPIPSIERSADGVVAHMVFPIEIKRMLDEAVVPSELGESLSARSAAPTSIVPEHVTVELFIVCDERHHKHFEKTKQLITYLIITVNSVNLRYGDTSAPKLQLRFTGVEKNTDYAFTSSNGEYMYSLSTLKEFKDYAKKKKKDYGDPDVTYLMTGSDLYSVDSSQRMDRSTRGIGYVGAVCTDFSVALGEDSAGYYSGVHTMTHETGHVLGSQHDQNPPATGIDGHPGSMSCPWDVGNIMSYVNTGPEHHRFSACSIEQMRFVITLRGKACWNINAKRKARKKEGRYPGLEVTMEKFCKRVFPDKENVTADLDSPTLQQCKVKCQYQELRSERKHDRIYYYTTTFSRMEDALDYMKCGGENVCIRGLCGPRPSPITKKPEVSTTTEESK